jgi:hypothetical protein
VDHYLDLTSGQRREVTARLHTLLSRHRTEALPQYEQFLIDLRQRVGRGLTRADLDWAYVFYDRFRADLFERVLPDGSALLTTVSEQQVRHLEQKLGQDETKAAKALTGAAESRLGERTKKVLALAEKWLGPLSAEQALQIRALARALPDAEPIWWQYRRQGRQELVALLRRPALADDLAPNLRRIFLPSDQGPPSSYRQMEKEWRAAFTILVLETDRMLTPLQRRSAMSSIQTVIDELQGLMRGA